VILSIALSYEEDGIVKPDRTMMGAGGKIVWLPDSPMPDYKISVSPKRNRRLPSLSDESDLLPCAIPQWL